MNNLQFEKFAQNEETLFYLLSKSEHKHSFEHNWLYILQATRNNPRKITLNKSVIYIGDHTTPDQKELVCVSMYGKDRYELLNRLISWGKSQNKNIIIKNVDLAHASKLTQMKFIETTVPWSEYSFRDDNSFPQLIYNANNFINRKGWYASARKALNGYFKKLDITTETFDFNLEQDARKLLQEYAEYSGKKGKDTPNEIIRAHELFFDQSINNIIRLQHKRNDKLIAVSCFAKVENCLYLNVLININEENIMRILLYEAVNFIVKAQPEIDTLISQGSESAGQHQWKLSFGPSHEIIKIHMIYNP